MNKVSKNDKHKTVIQSVSFVIMGITILDVLFYSIVQIFKGINKTNGAGVISLILSILGLALACFDLTQLAYFSFRSENAVTAHKENKENMATEKVNNVNENYIDLQKVTYSEESVSKSRLVKSLNIAFLLRFAVAHVIISIIENGPAQVILIFLVNLAYMALFGLTLFKEKSCCTSKIDMIQKIALEILIFIFTIILFVFNSDPENTKMTSEGTE